jgi:hypothetical protein
MRRVVGKMLSDISKESTARFFQTSGRNYPTTWRKNPEDLVPQQALGGNLKLLFSYCSEHIYSDYFVFFFYCVSFHA